MSHVYLVSGGSEAMEAALKLARQYFVEIGQPQRRQFARPDLVRIGVEHPDEGGVPAVSALRVDLQERVSAVAAASKGRVTTVATAPSTSTVAPGSDRLRCT